MIEAKAGRTWSWTESPALIGLALFALPPDVPGREIVLGVVGVGLIAACSRSLTGDGRFTRSARALIGALCLVTALGGFRLGWPFYLLVPMVVATALAFTFGFGRDLLATIERGRLGRTEWGLVALIAVVAAMALIGWVVLLSPDLTRLRAMLPDWPIPALVGAGLAFSVANAVLEEVIWRGVFQRWLMSFMPAAAAVCVQAASFGAAHYAGFPSGAIGMALAGVYGLMMGALALRSGGLAAPIVAHVVADAVIFAVLAGAADLR